MSQNHMEIYLFIYLEKRTNHLKKKKHSNNLTFETFSTCICEYMSKKDQKMSTEYQMLYELLDVEKVKLFVV